MALKITSLVLLPLFIHSISLSHATEADILCLKAIKDSLEDPFNYLNSWNFNNKTEGFICKFIGIECWHPDENKVLNIHLSNLGLEGNFPRGLQNCTSLQGLDLSRNRLSGTIPSDIGNLLPFLTTLDLSSNNFSGEIPKSLANCSYLNVLRLDHNRLSGSLPEELGLLSRIKMFTVGNNLLSGKVPDFHGEDIRKESYANNPQLCGGPLEPCLHKHHRRRDNSFKIGFGIGYLVSATSVFLLFSLTSLQVKMIMKIMVFSVVGKLNRKNDQLVHFPTLKHEEEIPGLERLVHRISFRELCSATDNFSTDNVIGIGRTGTMFKATLPNGWFLAVKKLYDCQQLESQFVSELLALGRFKHDNIIPLFGFCVNGNEKLLVYKYMSNGNLHDWLHPVQGEVKILEWPLRVKIAIGIARGLSWLHQNCNFRVVHYSISSTSILLDRHFEPKISNFGKTIISNYGGAMFVYADDNDSGFLVNSGIWESDFVKKDVYKYGILLLELLTLKETINTSSSTSSLHNTLVEWKNHISTSSCNLIDAIDKSLIAQGFDYEILEVLRIASDCVHPLPCERPTMLQVYKRISTQLGERYGINQHKANINEGEILPVETQ